MHKHQDMVLTFIKTFGQTYNSVPTWPSQIDAALRINLIMEETRELFEALLNDIDEPQTTRVPVTRSLIGIADACADMKYVIYGAGCTFGIELSHAEDKIGAFGFGQALKPTEYPPFKVASVVSKGMEANRRLAEAIVKNYREPGTANHPSITVEPTVLPALNNLIEYTYAVERGAGIDIDPIFDEVQRSNMSKVWPDGTVKKRESDGKVLKPPTYSPADLKSILEKQAAA